MILKQGTPYLRMFPMIANDHITNKTGLGSSPAVTLSKNGAAFGGNSNGSTGVAEVGSGWYYVVLSTIDTSTLGDLDYHITATGADPTDFRDQVAIQIFNDLTFPGPNNPAVQSNVKQGQQILLDFMMTDSTTHGPKTGLTVTAQRSLAGAAFASCANPVNEISNGAYNIMLAGIDTNAATVLLRFTAPGADTLTLTLQTQQ